MIMITGMVAESRFYLKDFIELNEWMQPMHIIAPPLDQPLQRRVHAKRFCRPWRREYGPPSHLREPQSARL